ncbi:MAG: hypothetical protein ACOYXT_08280 [Bacteroidota bacterium]
MNLEQEDKSIADFLNGKSEVTRELFDYFIKQCKQLGPVAVHPAKTMIGIATPRKRIAYVTQLGKNFVHIVFPFEKAYEAQLMLSENSPGPRRCPPVQSPFSDVQQRRFE